MSRSELCEREGGVIYRQIPRLSVQDIPSSFTSGFRNSPLTFGTVIMASRSVVLSALKGQRVRVPDLQALLQDWPQYTNPYYERLKTDVDAKLDESVTEEGLYNVQLTARQDGYPPARDCSR